MIALPNSQDFEIRINTHAAVKILKDLSSERNIPLYVTGGCVRDFLIRGSFEGDLDFVVECDATAHQELSAHFFQKVSDIPELITASKVDLIHCVSVREYVLQFDFTVNTIIFDVNTANFISDYGGLEDIENGVMRMTSPSFLVTSPKSFTRLFDQAAHLNFTIDATLLNYIKRYGLMVHAVTPANNFKVLSPLLKFLSRSRIEPYYSQMVDSDLLLQLFPELLALQSVNVQTDITCIQYNYELIRQSEKVLHTIHESFYDVLIEMQDYSVSSDRSRPEFRHQFSLNGLSVIRLACLFQNIGYAYPRLDKKLPSFCYFDSYTDFIGGQLMTNLVQRYPGNSALQSILTKAYQLSQDTVSVLQGKLASSNVSSSQELVDLMLKINETTQHVLGCRYPSK